MIPTLRKILQSRSKYKIAVLAILVLAISGGFWVVIASIPSSSFPRNAIIRINKDVTVSQAGTLLKEKGVIKSAFLFKVYVTLIHNGKGIQAGSYLFDKQESALRVAYRTAYGVKNIEKTRLTIVEGLNSKEITALLKKNIPGFAAADFLLLAKANEGYLFPETYFVDPDVRPREIIDMMLAQFTVSTLPLQAAIATSTHSLKDIIIMASILEEEANNTVDRRIISGILWKRLQKGMALQVDAPFYYLFSKGSSQLTLKDLATTSPYNTYVYKGLTPGPISNPSLNAIQAALNPTETPYYFYLADQKGVTHYATTHDGHVANKEKYLR